MSDNNELAFCNGKIKHALIKGSKKFKIQYGSVERNLNECSSFFIKGRAKLSLIDTQPENLDTVVADFRADAETQLNKILRTKYLDHFHKNHLLDLDFSTAALRSKNPKSVKINYTIYLRTLTPTSYSNFYNEALNLSTDFNEILINTTAPNLNLAISEYR